MRFYAFLVGLLVTLSAGANAANYGPMMIQQYGGDIDNLPLFRQNLGLGSVATLSLGSGSGCTAVSGILTCAGGNAQPGGSTGQVQINNGSGFGGFPTATAGASVILQTLGTGLIDPSTLPFAGVSTLGALMVDGTTIVVNPTTHVATAIGGAATSIVNGTTTIGGVGTFGHLLYNNGGILGDLPTSGSGSAVLVTSPTLITPNLGTPTAVVLTNATGLPLASGVTGVLQAAQSPAHTGDVTSSAGSLALTLATVNSGPGSVGSASAIPVLTTDGKGRTITQSTVPVVAPAGTLTGNALASGITGSSLTSAAGGTFGTGAFAPAGLPLAGGTLSGMLNTNGLTDNTLITALGGLAFTGTPTPSNTMGAVVNGTITYAYPGSGIDWRPRYWDSEATVTGTTSGVSEDNFFRMMLQGTGTVSGEINIVHPYFQLAFGTTTTGSVEIVEESNLILGNATIIQGNLSTLTNGVTGTTTQVIGYQSVLTNLNTTAGTVGEYDGFVNHGWGGSGTAPTVNYAFKNFDATASLTTNGNVVIGSIAAANPNVSLQIYGIDSTSANFAMIVRNAASKNLLTVDDNYSVVMGGTLTLGGSGSANAGNEGAILFENNTSGLVKVTVPAGVALGSITYTLPHELGGFFPYTETAPNGAGLQSGTGVGFGSSPTALGTYASAFNVVVGGGTPGTSATVTFPTAAVHGYVCTVTDTSNAAIAVQAVATSTTVSTWNAFTVGTMTPVAFGTGNVLTAQCSPY